MRSLKMLMVSFFICGLLSIISCSTGSDQDKPTLHLDGQWAESSLTSQSISRIKVSNAALYTSTSTGLYKQESSISTPTWNPIGLQKAAVRDFVVWGESELLASAAFPDSSIFIFRTWDGGTKWEPYQNGFGGQTNRIPSTLKKSSQNPNIIFARRGNNVAKSKDKGISWNSIYLEWGSLGAGPFIQQSKNVIWAGGANSIFEPQLFKSSDAGDTWERLTILENVETTVYDVADYPSDKNTVIAGLDIGIRKSTDGGQSWQTVLEDIGVRTFTHSARNPEIVYASGRNADGTLFFTASNNFGDTWQRVEWADSPASIQVNDMVSFMEDGHEVLYLGTNKGLYSYTFEE